MQQRQYRPGDVLDDYCPRERRVTDHAIVAMVESEIQRTRCVVCDAEHEFKNARVPAPRKKGTTAALFTQVLENLDAAPGRLAPPTSAESAIDPADPAPAPDESESAPLAASEPEPLQQTDDAGEDRPFRRSLIRAQLPRHEGQAPPTRAIPEFTMHQPQNLRPRRGGQRFRGRPQGGMDLGGPMRSGRHGGPGGGNGQGQGQGQGQGPGQGKSGRRRRRKKH